MSEHLHIEHDDGTAILTIDRPEKKNAMTYALLGEFIETIRSLGADPDVHVIILTGVPGAFCAGTDLSDLATIPGKERGVRGEAEDTDHWWPIVECPKPVIAAIDGPAVGMGAEFSSQCDLRLATPNARFAWNFAHRGLVPDTGAGSWLLPRLLGHQKALELLYTGRFVDAEEALALGYVLDVVAPEDLLGRARTLAAAIRAGSPFSHDRIKRLVYAGLGRTVGEHMVDHVQAMKDCFASDDHAEGVASFLERRPPRFTGR
jgi:enoyl-CoA hydratase